MKRSPDWPHMTAATVQILQALLEGPANQLYARALCRRVDRNMSTIHAQLSRLQLRGWLTSQFESGARLPHPPRRFYTLTKVGKQQAVRALRWVAEHKPNLLPNNQEHP